jgi:hypothetical protein
MKAARFSMFGGPEVLEIVDLPIRIRALVRFGSRCGRPASTRVMARNVRA